LSSEINVHLSDLLGVLQQEHGQEELGVTLPVRVVVANILAEIILLFVSDVYKALQPGGIYIASGIIERKEQVVVDAMVAAGFVIREINRDQDWVAIVAEKAKVSYGN
ncbi:MAG: 50S ribosomal protein L11 methyltransferase, partial [Gorillibacterium sp.]|nr:50S ribosomal protein L11 methyltransferase [Gorillibacterium sp.]